MINDKQQAVLKGKIKITAVIHLETGMHIGGSSDFAPIGAVDSPFIRNPYNNQPIIPGSSLKGKIRTLLAKSYADGYILNDIADDNDKIQRLFGMTRQNAARAARLQFSDCDMTRDSVAYLESLDLDTYLGEAKYENSIDRISAVANPRQIERVPAGAEFNFSLIYNVENDQELIEDMTLLANGIKLLTLDYLGGSGSRGYGRVSFKNFKVASFSLNSKMQDLLASKIPAIENLLKEY